MGDAGEYDLEDEDYNSIYANDVFGHLANVSELLKSTCLDDLLQKDAEQIKAADAELAWYHGKISREATENLFTGDIAKKGNIEGLFLVRDSTTNGNDFILSLMCSGKHYHYQIIEKFAGSYHIDDGPSIQGLENLITRHQEDGHGLPTRLTEFCKGCGPPERARKYGKTNILHRAVLEQSEELIQKVLENKHCQDTNAKNEWGSTALHDACNYGMEKIAELLIDHGADVNSKDIHGHTPLQRACVGERSSGTIPVLINIGKANLMSRCPKTGWVALHEAAMRGHTEAVKLLLDFHAPSMPRADDFQTPLDLAEKYDRSDCVALFESYEPPVPTTRKKDWYHPELDRQGAVKLLERHGMRDGMFVVRNSHRNPNWHVITLCHNRAIFNYEIRGENYREKFVHYIDDGPYMESLEHLIQHYALRGDGLPCSLSSFVTPSGVLDAIAIEEDYYNLADTASKTKQIPEAHRPGLPPRPLDLRAAPSPEPTSASPPPVPKNPPPASRPAKKTNSITLPFGDSKNELEGLVKIDVKQLKQGHEVGQGEFGSVVKGTYKKKEGKKEKKTDVAIKTFREGTVNNRTDFLKEARVMQELQHICIVQLLGVCEGPPLMLVEEFIQEGSMLDFLIDHSDKIEVKVDLYLWAAQIASGMTYLESKRFVHRDLAARNILLASKEQAKISDFGLSRAMGAGSNYYKATQGGKWPIKWYAPECVNYGHFSHESDVWSFGITLWEMFSFGDPPYGEMRGIEVISFIESENRLEKPEKCPDIVYDQMLKCWKKDPKDRPSFKDLNKHFENEPEYTSIKKWKDDHKK